MILQALTSDIPSFYKPVNDDLSLNLRYKRRMKLAGKVLMIRPTSFRSNEQTRGTNSFQTGSTPTNDILERAQAEHKNIQNLLLQHGIDVMCFEEEKNTDTPDALFPNNWFCTMPGGKTILFPMMAQNRRREFRKDVIHEINPRANVIDLRFMENESHFLEGTGSLILDHTHRCAYACLSPRTTARALREFEKISGYRVFSFQAFGPDGSAIYHTNVMMALGEKTVILYDDGIVGAQMRRDITERLKSQGREVVIIDAKQTLEFAGNMLQLKNRDGEKFWVGSTRAFEAFTDQQKQILESDAKLIHAPIPTIEKFGGGGVRCLLAEIF